MQAPRYLKGVSRSNSWIMSWSRQEVTWSKVGHNVSHVINTRQRNMIFVNQDQQRIRGRLKTAEANFSWTYQQHDTRFGGILSSKDLNSWRRGKGWMRGQKRLPKPMEAKITKWDVPTPTRMQTSAMFKSDILLTWLQTGSIFPHHFWRVPQLFLKTSLKGIAYACDVSFSFGQIQPSTFYEP